MRKTVAIVAALLAVSSGPPQTASARAPITVGDGTAASCTQAALQDALLLAGATGGGTIEFNCGGEAVTISLRPSSLPPGPPVLVLPDNTTIDGGGLITLNCRGGCFPLFVDGTTGVVRNLTIERGLVGIRNTGTLTVANSHFINNGAPGGGPGGIKNMGTLDVKHSTFSSSVGGGIENDGGTVTINHSTFSNNAGVGHISSRGTLLVSNSTFTDGHAFDAPAIATHGTATFKKSTFSHNNCGAISNSGDLTIEHSGFFSNRSVSFLCRAALDNAGSASIDHSVFFDNSHTFSGGAVSNSGTLTVSRSTIVSNIVGGPSFHGGGIYNSGTLTVDGSFIIGNTALGGGGGIYTCCGGTLTLHRTLVTDNTPDDIVP